MPLFWLCTWIIFAIDQAVVKDKRAWKQFARDQKTCDRPLLNFIPFFPLTALIILPSQRAIHTIQSLNLKFIPILRVHQKQTRTVGAQLLPYKDHQNAIHDFQRLQPANPIRHQLPLYIPYKLNERLSEGCDQRRKVPVRRRGGETFQVTGSKPNSWHSQSQVQTRYSRTFIGSLVFSDPRVELYAAEGLEMSQLARIYNLSYNIGLGSGCKLAFTPVMASYLANLSSPDAMIPRTQLLPDQTHTISFYKLPHT